MRMYIICILIIISIFSSILGYKIWNSERENQKYITISETKDNIYEIEQYTSIIENKDVIQKEQVRQETNTKQTQIQEKSRNDEYKEAHEKALEVIKKEESQKQAQQKAQQQQEQQQRQEQLKQQQQKQIQEQSQQIQQQIQQNATGISSGNILIESRIENGFNGLNQYTIFELTNGQVWIQTEYKYKYHYSYRPKATIYRKDSKYYIMIDGISDMVEVQQITLYKKSNIEKVVNNMGYSTTSAGINNKYFLRDGTVWTQTGLGVGVFLNNAKVIIATYGINYYMQIDGVHGSVQVK